MQIVLFDDEVARGWEPFALTRPIGELLFGALTFRERAEKLFRARVVGHLAARHLSDFEEEGSAPVVADAPREADTLYLLSRAVPAWSTRERWRAPERAGVVTVGGSPAAWFVPAGQHWTREGEVVAELEGSILEHVWEMIPESHRQAQRDIEALHPGTTTRLPPGVQQWGDHPVILGEGARIEPGAVLDTSEGPIWIDRGATVCAFTRLAGPSYIGPGSRILGGAVGPVCIGPVCRIRGEISESVCLGYTNKQHDGHIGHAYLGRWVNLGAQTTNSDLKNNYGTVRIWTPGGEQDTGAVKMGSLLGDHVKTGIGLCLNTGTVVGAGTNLWGAALPPTFVPPFSWGTGDELVEYRLDKFLEMAERAMQRREVALTASMKAQLGRAWEQSKCWRGNAP